MAFKMKGKSPMTKKLCGASAYKKVFDPSKELNNKIQGKKPKVSYDDAYKKRDMKLYGGLNKEDYVKEAKRQKSGGKVPNKPMTSKSGAVLGPGISPKPAPKFEKIEPKKIDKIEVKKAKPELKKALAQKALTKKEVRKTKRKAVAAKIFGDGSKRKANEANKKKRENRSVTGRMKNKASKFRRPGDM